MFSGSSDWNRNLFPGTKTASRSECPGLPHLCLSWCLDPISECSCVGCWLQVSQGYVPQWKCFFNSDHSSSSSKPPSWKQQPPVELVSKVRAEGYSAPNTAVQALGRSKPKRAHPLIEVDVWGYIAGYGSNNSSHIFAISLSASPKLGSSQPLNSPRNSWAPGCWLSKPNPYSILILLCKAYLFVSAACTMMFLTPLGQRVSTIR